jgi:hypothetical protein
LVRPQIRIVNREIGWGARLAVDEGLKELGLPNQRIKGYTRELPRPLEIDEAIASGQADAGVTIGVAAKPMDSHLSHLEEERYDLAFWRMNPVWAQSNRCSRRSIHGASRGKSTSSALMTRIRWGEWSRRASERPVVDMDLLGSQLQLPARCSP